MRDIKFEGSKFLRKERYSKDSANHSSKMSGARFIAETFKGYGVTHVFFVESILNRTLVEVEALGIRRVMTHSEKAAAYMADGYARASHKPIWHPDSKTLTLDFRL